MQIDKELVTFMMAIVNKLAKKANEAKSLTEALTTIECLAMCFENFPDKPIQDDEAGICCLYQAVQSAKEKANQPSLELIAQMFLHKLEAIYPEYKAHDFVIDDL